MSYWAATDSVSRDGSGIDVGRTADLASAGVYGAIWLETGCGRGDGLLLKCGLMALSVENGENCLVGRQEAC